ncbi:MAG: hypothetical protein M3Z83_05740 [Actinomycetota bacterium]|nr:hypothetical protein [Actinomycetota bacterium]
MPRLTSTRAGLYVITDAQDREIGTVYGDYVIGFTVSCWDLRWRFKDLEEVKAAIAKEALTRTPALAHAGA